MISRVLLVCIAMLASFEAGSWLHEVRYGRVSISTYVDDGGPLNRGQQQVSIRFPDSVRPEQLVLPDGTIFPDTMRGHWVRMLPDGNPQTWIDHIDLDIVGSGRRMER